MPTAAALPSRHALGPRAALAVALASACGGDPWAPPGAAAPEPRLSVTPQRAELRPGERQRFSLAIADAGGVPRPARSVRWRSSDPAVVTIDAGGLATAHREGTATITAAVGEDTATGTAVVCDPCLAPTPEVHESPGPAASPAPTGPPPPDPRRPPEIVDVSPAEDAVVDPVVIPDCGPIPCGAPSFILSFIQVATRFPGEDEPAAGRMWVDGREVPVEVQTETPVPGMFIDGYVTHRLYDHPLGAGPHEVTVEVTSREGRTVSYTWRFTLTEPTRRP
jgi:Bacterial Ig-like domain (group 2)